VSSGLLTRVDHDTALRAGVAAIMRVKAREQQVVPQTRPELFEHQRPKRDDWAVWLLIGGRGSGKTEAGARFVDEHAASLVCPVLSPIASASSPRPTTMPWIPASVASRGCSSRTAPSASLQVPRWRRT
jgi:hypothetical protein